MTFFGIFGLPYFVYNIVFTSDPSYHFFILVLVPLFFILVGSAFGIPALISIRRSRQIHRNGVAVVGRVVSIRKSWLSAMFHNAQVVEYVFIGPNGESSGSWVTEFPPSQGEPIWILYDSNGSVSAFLKFNSR